LLPSHPFSYNSFDDPLESRLHEILLWNRGDLDMLHHSQTCRTLFNATEIILGDHQRMANSRGRNYVLRDWADVWNMRAMEDVKAYEEKFWADWDARFNRHMVL